MKISDVTKMHSIENHSSFRDQAPARSAVTIPDMFINTFLCFDKDSHFYYLKKKWNHVL